MTRPCQDCFAHRANWAAKNRGHRITGDAAHDLCRRCFRRRLDSINARERQGEFRKAALSPRQMERAA